jgi:mitogen-activated protein kinase 1/3
LGIEHDDFVASYGTVNTPGDTFLPAIPTSRSISHRFVAKMLVLDPTERVTALEALQHPYMSGLYDPRCNPPARVPIDLNIDENCGEQIIREMMWNEMLHYHPEAASAKA